MSVYSIKGKGYRYDFTLKGIRYTATWFKTKTEAKQAESERRKEVKNPKPVIQTSTDIAFLELVNRRLDHLKAYGSENYYSGHICFARKWVEEWEGLTCREISIDTVQSYLFKRKKVSACVANYDLRCLRALFNFGVYRGWISVNPTKGIDFFPVEKKEQYVPPKEDTLKVILAADPNTQDYLYVIRETMGRMSEVNHLTWADVSLNERYVIFYTRKKKGGHLTPRKIPMTGKLHEVLSHRHKKRDKGKPWVFWHRYWSRKESRWIEGPYKDRKRIMRSLCRKAGVRYFRYHPLRHLGASTLDHANVNIGSIQRILGHESRRTTEIYLHSIGEAEREAMMIFEEVSQNPHTDSHTSKAKGVNPNG